MNDRLQGCRARSPSTSGYWPWSAAVADSLAYKLGASACASSAEGHYYSISAQSACGSGRGLHFAVQDAHEGNQSAGALPEYPLFYQEFDGPQLAFSGT